MSFFRTPLLLLLALLSDSFPVSESHDNSTLGACVACIGPVCCDPKSTPTSYCPDGSACCDCGQAACQCGSSPSPGPQTYHLNVAAFNAGAVYNDNSWYACRDAGGTFDAKFMAYPYININTKLGTITANSAGTDGRACIYQSTESSCNFNIQSSGLQQLDFDYAVDGPDCANSKQWFSFWFNTKVDGKNHWVQDAEMDVLEQIPTKKPAYLPWHNWATEPKEAPFALNHQTKGHVTTKLSPTQASTADCDQGAAECTSGFVATHSFAGGTTNMINAGSLTHFLEIDMWVPKGSCRLTVFNIVMKGGSNLKTNCNMLLEMGQEELRARASGNWTAVSAHEASKAFLEEP